MRKHNLPPEKQLNLNVRGIPVSATLAINELSAKLKREGRTVFRLGLGQSPFPVPEPVVESLRENAFQKDYLQVMGLPELREAVARYHNLKEGLEHKADDVLIGPGSKELMFLLQFVYYGDLVIPTPSWVSYAPQAHIIGRHVRWAGTTIENGWRLMPEELDAICRDDPSRPRILILNYPSNPAGTTYKTDELKELARIARKYRVILLSDEIYGELHFRGQHVSISRFYPEGTIISSGLSKWCGAGGWRLGTFTFPESLRWLRDGMAAVASETFTSTSAPIQYAAVTAFNKGDYINRYLNASRLILRTLTKTVTRQLSARGVRIPVPEGAFYIFPSFDAFAERFKAKGIKNSLQFTNQLLKDTGVAILPGMSFGRNPEEFTARLALVDFDGSAALQALLHEEINGLLPEGFLLKYCTNVMLAVEKMGEWLESS